MSNYSAAQGWECAVASDRGLESMGARLRAQLRFLRALLCKLGGSRGRLSAHRLGMPVGAA